jgi:hypothetical protein
VTNSTTLCDDLSARFMTVTGQILMAPGSGCNAASRLGLRKAGPSLRDFSPSSRQLRVWPTAKDGCGEHLGGFVEGLSGPLTGLSGVGYPVLLNLAALRAPSHGSFSASAGSTMTGRLRGNLHRSNGQGGNDNVVDVRVCRAVRAAVMLEGCHHPALRFGRGEPGQARALHEPERLMVG